MNPELKTSNPHSSALKSMLIRLDNKSIKMLPPAARSNLSHQIVTDLYQAIPEFHQVFIELMKDQDYLVLAALLAARNIFKADGNCFMEMKNILFLLNLSYGEPLLSLLCEPDFYKSFAIESFEDFEGLMAVLSELDISDQCDIDSLRVIILSAYDEGAIHPIRNQTALIRQAARGGFSSAFRHPLDALFANRPRVN